MSTPNDDFPPGIYAFLAILVTSGFAIAGHIAWWWVVVTAALVYLTERMRQRRKAKP